MNRYQIVVYGEVVGTAANFTQACLIYATYPCSSGYIRDTEQSNDDPKSV